MRCESAICAGMLLLALAMNDARAHAQQCVGDCDGDGAVGVSELITCVNIALGASPLATCPTCDFDGDGQVLIGELTRAVNDAIGGCHATVEISGGCARPGPGPGGLVVCDEGTSISAYRCDDRATCLGSLTLPLAGATAVQTNGDWAMLVDVADASASLVFQAAIEGAITYRALDFGTVGGRLIAGAPQPRTVGISPTSEATVRLLDLNGLEHFDDQEIAAVQTAVAAATEELDFSVLAASGYSAADAADLATLTAVRDPDVTNALEDGAFDPGTLPTRTATPTATPTPTATATPLRRFAFVANLASNTVSVIDTNTDAVVATIAVGQSPQGVAITPDGRLALIANSGPAEGSASDVETVSVIDTAQRQVVSTVPDFSPNAFTRPSAIAVSPDGALAYVSHNASATVEVLDLSRALTAPATARVGVIMVGPAPLGIALARSRPLAFVASVESRTLSVVDTDMRQTVGEVPLPGKPAFVAFTSDDALAYVTDQLVVLPGQSGDAPGSTVSVVDTQRALDNPADAVIDTIDVGLQPTGLAISADDRLVHVANAGSASLSIIDRDQPLVSTIPLLGGSIPQSVALTADGTRAYVTNCGLNSVTVIDVALARTDPLNAVVKTIPVGICPQGIGIAELP